MVETRLDAGCPNAQSQPQIPGRVRHFPSPPFINIDGLHNFRDCGGYPIAGCPDKIIRQGVLYRSADPSKITTKGISQLGELNVSRVFDLRSDSEIEDSTKKGWGQIRVWDQVVRVPAAVFTDDDIANEQRASQDHNLRNKGIEVYRAEFTAAIRPYLAANSIWGFVKYYQDILDSATSASNPFQPLKNILSHLATASALEPILIHCSLGKDRTGVICALILSICGVQDSIVAHEYGLTALGIEGKIASIITEIRPNGPGISEQEERFFSSRVEAMQAFLEWARRNGGVERIVLEAGLMTPDQLQQLRDNLVIDLPSGRTYVAWEEHEKILARRCQGGEDGSGVSQAD